MKSVITFLLAATLWFYSGIGFAQESINIQNDTAIKNSSINNISSTDDTESLDLNLDKDTGDINYISMISSLLSVILIILVVAWIYKKFIGVSAEKLLSGKIKEAKENAISVLTTTPIGQNKYLHLIEVKNQKFLIGSTSNDIVMLKEIDSQENNKGVR